MKKSVGEAPCRAVRKGPSSTMLELWGSGERRWVPGPQKIVRRVVRGLHGGLLSGGSARVGREAGTENIKVDTGVILHIV